jgi:hypothetical protein
MQLLTLPSPAPGWVTLLRLLLRLPLLAGPIRAGRPPVTSACAPAGEGKHTSGVSAPARRGPAGRVCLRGGAEGEASSGVGCPGPRLPAVCCHCWCHAQREHGGAGSRGARRMRAGHLWRQLQVAVGCKRQQCVGPPIEATGGNLRVTATRPSPRCSWPAGTARCHAGWAPAAAGRAWCGEGTGGVSGAARRPAAWPPGVNE